MKTKPVDDTAKRKIVKNEEEEDMKEQFRSFSVLEEEKKDLIPIIDKNTKSSKKISNQDLISPEVSEGKVRRKSLNNFLFSHKSTFSRVNHLY
jgi:hypothetical protein